MRTRSAIAGAAAAAASVNETRRWRLPRADADADVVVDDDDDGENREEGARRRRRLCRGGAVAVAVAFAAVVQMPPISVEFQHRGCGEGALPLQPKLKPRTFAMLMAALASLCLIQMTHDCGGGADGDGDGAGGGDFLCFALAVARRGAERTRQWVCCRRKKMMTSKKTGMTS